MDNRPHITAILAMTADGKIADHQGTAARFGSPEDKIHLEQQVSLVDGVIFGANTLRAYGTTISVRDAQLLQARKERSQSPQPVQIVVSASGNLNPAGQFFQQSVPRWLLTLPDGGQLWQKQSVFHKVLVVPNSAVDHNQIIDWQPVVSQLLELGIHKLAVLGGGELVASFLAGDLLDELWLTLCPLILGGNTAPTPVGGAGWLQTEAKKLKLLAVKQLEQELFIHYRVLK